MTRSRVGFTGEGFREAPPPQVTFRAIELPSGDLLPIEVRMGRRVLRFVPPESEEGRRLLSEDRVEIVRGPVGSKLG